MHNVGFIVPPAFQLMSIAPRAAFEIANLLTPEPHYDLQLLSEHGGSVRSSCGLTVETKAYGHQSFDTIVVGSITTLDMTASTPSLISFIRRAAEASQRTASICSGAFVLAEAGLLDGRRATTHWFHAASFRARFPAVRLEEDRIYINDGQVWTSAGMTAGIDLVLAMIEQDLGPEVAKGVAQLLVIHQRRLGGQRQHSALLDLVPKTDRIDAVLTHVRQHLRNALSIEELANVARLSPRQFSRAFMAETGQSPARAVEQIRLEAARFMIEGGRHPVNVVAKETGFADRERMRRAFLRTFGVPPQVLRRSARSDREQA